MISTSFLLWATRDTSLSFLLKKIDKILPSFKYYPEYEWSTYKVRPPEKYPLIGSWRKENSDCFVFLMQNNTINKEVQYIVYLSGTLESVNELTSQITRLKGIITRTEEKLLKNKNLDNLLNKEHETKTTKKLLTIVSIYTAIINVFSYYMRKIPIPSFEDKNLIIIYQLFITVIHFLALLLFLLVIVLIISYVIKYGILIIKRR